MTIIEKTDPGTPLGMGNWEASLVFFEPVPDSNFMIEADAIVPAISQDVNLDALAGVEVKLSRWKTIEVDETTMQSSLPWLFAGGDAVLGPETAAKAIYQAK